MQTLNTAPESLTRIVWQAALPKGCSKTVLACLAWHAVLNEHDQCWPYIDTIARLCGFQRRTVIAHLAALVKAGLVTSTPRPGTSNLYQINRAALVALSSEQPAERGDENADMGAENAARGAENARGTAFSAPIREKERKEKEEGRERDARAPGNAAPAEAAFPPLLDLESLNTEDPVTAPAIATTMLPGQMLTPTAPAATEPAVAIAPDTLAAVNAQRACNGKEPLQRADLVELGRQATLAGIAPQAAAEWILSKSTRNFFQAGWLNRPSAPTPPAAPAPQDEATWAQARARADQVQADLLRRSIEAMRAPVLVGRSPAAAVTAGAAAANPGAASAVAARTAPIRTATLRAAPVAIGAATGTGWARDAVQRFTAGQDVSRATIASAAVALGLPMAGLKAQRAAHLAGVAA